VVTHDWLLAGDLTHSSHRPLLRIRGRPSPPWRMAANAGKPLIMP